MSNVERTVLRLNELAAMGVHTSIDDFGTGYSSLNYLKRLPIQKLKIDQSFIKDIATDPDDRAIIGAVTAMAHHMRMKVIAEGVETEAQLSFLRDTHCDEAQGYLFSRPLPADEFRELITGGSSPLTYAGIVLEGDAVSLLIDYFFQVTKSRGRSGPPGVKCNMRDRSHQFFLREAVFKSLLKMKLDLLDTI